MADRNDATPPPGPFIRSYAAEGRFQHTDAERASVLFYPSGGYSVATVRGITHHGKRIYDRRPTSICEIALGTFESSLELSLPALGGTTFFRAEVDIQWQAVDPHQAAVSVVRDVVRQLRAPVLERLRRIARDYRVSDAQNADSAIAAECQSGRWGDLGNDIGLQTRVFVRLTVDDKTIAEVERLRDVRAEHHVSMTAEEQQAELIALRKMGLREVLAGDHLDALVHMLAVRPEQLPEFMEKLRQENRSDQQRFTSHVLEMIESGRIHSVDLEQQVRRMLGAHSPYPLNDALGPAPVHRVEQQPALGPGSGPGGRGAGGTTAGDSGAGRFGDGGYGSGGSGSSEADFVPDWMAEEPPRRSRPASPPPPPHPSPSRWERDDEPAARPSRRDPNDGWPWVEEDE